MSFLPNLLTSLRFVLAPVVAWAFWKALQTPDVDATTAITGHLSQTGQWALITAALFIVAALTDLFDGMAARAFDAESKFGRILDPIADKALVGLPLIVLSIAALENRPQFWWVIVISSAVIIGRDILITVLRMIAPDGEGARVSSLAKWKTTAELLAVGTPILLTAAPAFMSKFDLGSFSLAPWMHQAWLALLAFAAILSALTAVGYLTAGASKPAKDA